MDSWWPFIEQIKPFSSESVKICVRKVLVLIYIEGKFMYIQIGIILCKTVSRISYPFGIFIEVRGKKSRYLNEYPVNSPVLQILPPAPPNQLHDH